MTCHRKSEGCLRLFGVNIRANKPITCCDPQSLRSCHQEKKIDKEQICKDVNVCEELDQQLHNNNMGTYICAY